MKRLTVTILAILVLHLAFPCMGATPPPPKEGETTVKTEAPVVFEGKTLFSIGGALSFSADERAKAIAARIDRLSRDPLFRPDTISVIDSGTTADVFSADVVIMSVTEPDAQAAGRSKLELAREYAKTIRAAMELHDRDYSIQNISLGIFYALAITLLLIALLVALKRVIPRIRAKIESWRGTVIRSIRFQSIEILNEERIVSILISAIRGGTVILAGVLLYFYIPLVLSFFPWTRGAASTIFEYILTPFRLIGAAVWHYLPKLLFLVVIILVTHYVIRFVRFFFREVEKGSITIPSFYTEWAEPTFKIARFLIIAFAAVVSFPYLPGSDSPAFKGISIFLGVLFSLGSTSAVANIVAGVIIIYMRAFKIGDRVKIADTVGDVVEKNLLVTRVRTIKNVDITLPNSVVLGSHIINFSSSAQSYGLILHTGVTIGYDVPWRKVHELLIAAAQATENILPMPAPFVFQTSLDDYYVSYELNAYTDTPKKMQSIYSELHQNIQDRFNEAGVEIMSPHFTQLRDGNRSTIPEQYLPEGYVPDALRVATVKGDGKDGNNRGMPLS